MSTLILSNKYPNGKLNIINEHPYCKIISVRVNSIGIDNYIDIQTIFNNITLTVISKNDKGSSNESIIALSAYISPTLIEPEINISYVIEDFHKYDYFELVYNNSHPDDLEIEIYYENKNHNISFENPFVKFKEHIVQNDNMKILFSAPFGQGKSTFIKHFFEKNKEYNIFNLFPVNYSISHNEDIFKYIKAEIFVKLLEISIFDKTTFSKMESAYFFLHSNKHLLIPLVKLLPQIGESAFELAKFLTDFETKFKEYIDEVNVDEANEVFNYIEELGIQEGSVFEDNFYTKLIRQQLYKLKEESKRKNVLIIDDLDRMDPDHIFRILNVFAAHFDSEHNSEYPNKFGFDKIILVGDYNNLKNIFEYKYGPKVEFSGYINKYYSKAPFIYDNKKAITAIINDINKGTRLYDSEFYSLDLLSLILKDLVDVNEITLRSLIKLEKYDAPKELLNKKYKANNPLKNEYIFFTHFNIIKYLSLAFDLDTLLNKLEICKKLTTNQDNLNYQKYTELGLPSLVDNKKGYLEECDFNEIIKIDKTELLLSFKIVRGSNIRDEYQYYEVDKLKKKINISDSIGESITFSKSDFYTILILNLHKYISVGGFE